MGSGLSPETTSGPPEHLDTFGSITPVNTEGLITSPAAFEVIYVRFPLINVENFFFFWNNVNFDANCPRTGSEVDHRSRSREPAVW